MNQTQDLIKNINESPSDLLLKQKEIKYGPGRKMRNKIIIFLIFILFSGCNLKQEP